MKASAFLEAAQAKRRPSQVTGPKSHVQNNKKICSPAPVSNCLDRQTVPFHRLALATCDLRRFSTCDDQGEPVRMKAAQKKGWGFCFMRVSFACLRASDGVFPSERRA